MLITPVIPDPITGEKTVNPNSLYIERKEKYVFILNHCLDVCSTIAPYAYQNNTVTKEGAVALVQFMESDALLTREDWGNPDLSNVLGIFIVLYDVYHFELRAYTNESQIPIVQEGIIEAVFTSEDVSDNGMQELVGTFLTWYMSTEDL